MSLIPVAGMKTFGPGTGSLCRGLITLEDEAKIYAFKGLRAVHLDSSGTETEIGLVPGEGPIYLARNDAGTQQIALVANDQPYSIVDNEISSLQYDFTPIGVTFCGGRFVYWLSNGRFYWSDINSTNVQALSFATAESFPDGLTAAHGVANSLYLIGTETTEVWAVTESADAPFARVGGAHLRFGTNSPHSVRSFANGVAFVGSDNAVYMVNGYNEQIISSNEVARLIEAETDNASIIAFTHQRGANRFYCLQGATWTREFNAATQTWHNREGVRGVNWHCVHHVKAFNRDFYGDSETGQLFEGDYTIHTDNSDELVWGFDTMLLHDHPNGLSFERVDIDLEAGDGESLSDPGEVMLSWSDDNGRTYRGERRLSLGKTGEYDTRVRAHRLGQCSEKGRSFRVRITDPVKRSIAGMTVEVTKVVL